MKAQTIPADTGGSRRLLFLLILVGGLHVIYPLTLTSGGQPSTIGLVVYQFLYVLMVLAGIWVASDSRLHLVVTVAAGGVYLVFSLLYSLDPFIPWKITTTYLALIVYQAALVLILLRYVLQAPRVTDRVLYAALTVYLLLGALFVPLYGMLDFFQPGALVDNLNPGQPLPWQTLVYFSYNTLTTAGYGDVLPVSPWARALANVEMVTGVLYLAVLVGRLVGLFSQRD